MGSWYRFYGILYIMISISQGLLVYDAYGLSVDEENRTIISKADKKNPIDIMKIDRIARHVSKKGKLRYRGPANICTKSHNKDLNRLIPCYKSHNKA